MGREIRKVPADWQHPRWTEDDALRPNLVGKYRPLFDHDYDSVAREWVESFRKWSVGTHENQDSDYAYYWEYEDPPSKDSYRERTWTEADATHFMVYETVSEGTPVTPAFATAEELIEHLATVGTDWDHGQPWDRKSATKFVHSGWAPSAIMRPGVGVKTVNESGFYE